MVIVAIAAFGLAGTTAVASASPITRARPATGAKPITGASPATGARPATGASPAASGGGWRVVATGSLPCREWRGQEYNAVIQDVTALSARDAWSAGQCVVAGSAAGSVAGIAGHWDGRRWTFSRLAAQASLDLFRAART